MLFSPLDVMLIITVDDVIDKRTFTREEARSEVECLGVPHVCLAPWEGELQAVLSRTRLE